MGLRATAAAAARSGAGNLYATAAAATAGPRSPSPGVAALRALGSLGVTTPGTPTRSLATRSPERPPLYRRSPSPLPRESQRRALGDTIGRIPRPFQLAGSLPKDRSLKLQEAWQTISQAEVRSRQEIKSMSDELEAKRKEMRQITGIHSRMQWDVWREERKQQNLEWKQSEEERRALTAELETGLLSMKNKGLHEEKLSHLENSYNNHIFKSNARSKSREADRDHQLHQKNHYAQHASMQRDIAEKERGHSREIVLDRRRGCTEQREQRGHRKLAEQHEERNAAYDDRKAELAEAMRKLTAEKEKLLGSIQYSTTRCAASPVSDRAKAWTTAQGQRSVSRPLLARN